MISSKKRIIIFDRQAITQTGMEWLVKQAIPSAVILLVNSKGELIRGLITHPDSLVILDYTSSDINSADGLLNICARFQKVHWILFSEELTVLFLKRVIVGNDTFSVVLKHSELEEIRKAILLANENKPFICQQISDLFAKPENNEVSTKEVLTLTEREILREIALGRTAKEIAALRNLSVHTVITHRKNIYRKLEINNAQELTHYAMRAGVINVSDYSI